MSIRDLMLEASRKKIYEDVTTPFGVVRVKACRGIDYDRVANCETESERNAMLVAMTVTDPETGERIFDDDSIGALANGNVAVIYGLVQVAKRLMVLTEDDAKKLSTQEN